MLCRSDNVTLTDFAITNCTSRLDGGVIDVVQARNVTIDGLMCTGNMDLCLSGFQASIDMDNMYSANNTSIMGGAILIIGNSRIAIRDSMLLGNLAQAGGAISAIDSEVHLSSTVLRDNYAKHVGGALLLTVSCFLTRIGSFLIMALFFVLAEQQVS